MVPNTHCYDQPIKTMVQDCSIYSMYLYFDTANATNINCCNVTLYYTYGHKHNNKCNRIIFPQPIGLYINII